MQFAIGIIDGDEKITYGLEMNENWEKLDNASSIFEIGSVSKVFTSLLLTQAEERELLKITDTIQHDLDIGWKIQQPITYQMLANHTSGLPRIPSNLLKDALLHPENPYAKYDEEALVIYLEKKMKLKTNPGEEYAYSNLGAGLLAYLVCEQLEMSYEEALRQMIFNKLEMDHSSSERSSYNEAEIIQGLNKKGKPTSNWDFEVMAGAGAIKSNVEDMLKFMDAQLNDENESIEKLQAKTFEGDRFDLALGWHIIPDEEWLWHNGGTGGYKSSLVLDPETNKGVVILTNISSGHQDARFIDYLGFLLLKETIKDKSV
ncbi:MAG: serine hydrolase domain-containing protein [Bacteroidota bacterium]